MRLGRELLKEIEILSYMQKKQKDFFLDLSLFRYIDYKNRNRLN